MKEVSVINANTGEKIVIPDVFAMEVAWNGLQVIAWRESDSTYGLQYLHKEKNKPKTVRHNKELVHEYFESGSYVMKKF
jgi:hypothetical protein